MAVKSKKLLDAKSSAEPGMHNGNFLGLEFSVEESKALVFPVPWDVTTSYRAGTVSGPESVIEASYQIDLYSPTIPEFWRREIGTLPLSKKWMGKSRLLRKKVDRYIRFLEKGGDVSKSKAMQSLLKEVNQATSALNDWVYQETRKYLDQGQAVFVLGGDHSVPFGAIKAYSEKYKALSVLHFDAHADLRERYEGFTDSHASIMRNVVEKTKIERLVQVGIRDVSQLEVDHINSDPKIKTYFDWDLKKRQYSGESWSKICQEIVGQLGNNVYISFDVDGLDPKLCPNTGTPVPGGLEFREAVHLIQAITESGRRVVGADLVEVAPGKSGTGNQTNQNDQWDGNVGARMLVQLLTAHFLSI